jgi:hypothetical protein
LTAGPGQDTAKGRQIGAVAPFGEKRRRVEGGQLFRDRGRHQLIEADAFGLGELFSGGLDRPGQAQRIGDRGAHEASLRKASRGLKTSIPN